MPETRFIEFPALPVDPRVGISRNASETDFFFIIFLTYDIYDIKNISYHSSFLLVFDILRSKNGLLRTSYGVLRGVA